MDKREWRMLLGEHSGEFMAIVKETRSVTHTPGRAGIIGSARRDESSRGEFSLFLIDPLCLTIDDATVLLTRTVAELLYVNPMFGISSVHFMPDFIQKVRAGKRPTPLFAKEGTVHLPTSFLEEPLRAEVETFTRTMEKEHGHTNDTIVTKLFIGDEKVADFLKANRRLEKNECRIAVAELWSLGGNDVDGLPASLLDPALLLKELHGLLRARALLIRSLEGIETHKESEKIPELGQSRDSPETKFRNARLRILQLRHLFAWLGLLKHPLVETSKMLLDGPASLPSPELIR
ncbi:hypothetical protein KBA73_03595 [Patescibacteria group bacterium]|nr:hypothetical protein [Patescibacteria group bacterium]